MLYCNDVICYRKTLILLCMIVIRLILFIIIIFFFSHEGIFLCVLLEFHRVLGTVFVLNICIENLDPSVAL